MRTPDTKRPGVATTPGPHHKSPTPVTAASRPSPRILEGTRTSMKAYEIRGVNASPSRRRVVDLPASRAFGLPPVPGRTMWAVVVLSCSHCGAGHVHRSGDASMVLSGKLIRRCPATRQQYRLGPVQRRREARVYRVAWAA